MIGIETVMKLAKAFPGGFLNGQGEFIAHKKANEYFLMADCKTELEVKCKVLEWLSRGAHKTQPFYRQKDNDNWYKGHCASGPCATMETDAGFYCGNFSPKKRDGHETTET